MSLKKSGEGKYGDKKAHRTTPDTLIAEAKEMAGQDAKALAAIEEIQTMGSRSRGAIGGCQYHSDVIGVGDEHVYVISFVAGEWATVSAVGDGTSDLDLYVYDEHDNLVECDTDMTDACYCSFVPVSNGSFTIKLNNHGPEANAYELRTD